MFVEVLSMRGGVVFATKRALFGSESVFFTYILTHIRTEEEVGEEGGGCVGCVDGCIDKKNTMLFLCYAYVKKIVINIKFLSQSASSIFTTIPHHHLAA